MCNVCLLYWVKASLSCMCGHIFHRCRLPVELSLHWWLVEHCFETLIQHFHFLKGREKLILVLKIKYSPSEMRRSWVASDLSILKIWENLHDHYCKASPIYNVLMQCSTHSWLQIVSDVLFLHYKGSLYLLYDMEYFHKKIVKIGFIFWKIYSFELFNSVMFTVHTCATTVTWF